jgi:hypothetical protein
MYSHVKGLRTNTQFHSTSPQVEESPANEEALDFRGISGWDKVDRLARTLIDIKGLSVTNTGKRDQRTL